MIDEEPVVVALSRRQLDAYNRADLEGFCACYHPDIEVLDAEGKVSQRGMEAFRARYATMFATFRDVRASVDQRVVLSPHVVERERWSRVHRETGEETSGVVLVRYTEVEGLLRYAEFLR